MSGFPSVVGLGNSTEGGDRWRTPRLHRDKLVPPLNLAALRALLYRLATALAFAASEGHFSECIGVNRHAQPPVRAHIEAC